jgi:hypothetical protein
MKFWFRKVYLDGVINTNHIYEHGFADKYIAFFVTLSKNSASIVGINSYDVDSALLQGASLEPPRTLYYRASGQLVVKNSQ